jgi:hypothetical protein
MKKYSMIFALAMFALSTASFAGTSAANTNTVSPTLTISATIQSAVQLTLNTGTVAAAHCTPTPGGGTPDYTMAFGNVDALGINPATCGSKSAPTTPGTTDAIYWSDYNLVPVFTSQSTVAASTIKAAVTTNFAGSNIYVVHDSANSSALPLNAAAFTALSILPGTPDAIVPSAQIISGTAVTRFIGVGVKPTNGAALTGPQSATVTFTLTVQ